MKTSYLTLLGASLFCVAITQNADAQDNIKDFKAGKTVTGDKVDLDDLKGRVVAIEYWGPR